MMFPFRERPPVLARPKNLFAYSEQDVSIARLAAAYAKGIVANHPFLDGDKRISFTVSLIFLMLNRVPTFRGHEAGEISEEQLVLRFERNMAPR
jgi:prophage maintenance system killer protein